MTWARRFRRREAVRQSLWLVPLGGAVAGALVAWGAASVGDTFDMPAALTFTPSTASSVLSAILGAMIGLVGFVVTVTVLLVQTSTGQFSARYMRLLYRDQLLKAVLAVLLGTFAYSFVLLRRVGESEAPDLGVLVVGALVLLGVVLFLVFLSRILQRLRPVAAASAVAKLGTRAFLALVQPAASAASPESRHGSVHLVVSTRAGTIQAVFLEGLLEWAQRHSCTLVFRHGVGDFVHVGSPLLEIRGPSPPAGADGALEGMVALGKERTVDQDPAFAVRVLVDIANRALSAAVNDPTTATQVLDYVEDMLLVIGRKDFSGRGGLLRPRRRPPGRAAVARLGRLPRTRRHGDPGVRRRLGPGGPTPAGPAAPSARRRAARAPRRGRRGADAARGHRAEEIRWIRRPRPCARRRRAGTRGTRARGDVTNSPGRAPSSPARANLPPPVRPPDDPNRPMPGRQTHPGISPM
jgi:hypothetical protein